MGLIREYAELDMSAITDISNRSVLGVRSQEKRSLGSQSANGSWKEVVQLAKPFARLVRVAHPRLGRRTHDPLVPGQLLLLARKLS